MKKRKSGILLPVASLPSEHGIGDFGPRAFEFIKILKKMDMKIWQILPINPLGYGNSPYQPYSSYAGETSLISLNKLVTIKLLDKDDLKLFNHNESMIDYQAVEEYKNELFKKAFKKFNTMSEVFEEEYSDFVMNSTWVYDYSVFIALKRQNDNKCWLEWPTEQKNWINDKKYNLDHLKDEIAFNTFLQFLFNRQWMELKSFANKNNVEIMGDIPIYVGIDSLDVWANQECFLLDSDNNPTHVAGVPPDYFSATGQRWGNPIYNWEYLEETNFKFWVDRLGQNSELFDIIRIDHFRAFDTYWKIPSTCETAIDGEWVEAPGYKLFDTIFKELPNINIVVEDLGELRKEVLELRDHYEFAGMKIIQFTFDPNETNNDFEDKENMLIYTGTHDNQTIVGWYQSQPKKSKKATAKFLNKKFEGQLNKQMMEYCLSSIANTAIIPVQDILGLDDSGRLNTPGTVGSPNWQWKMTDFSKLNTYIKYLKAINIKYDR